ncbi:acyl carrier protein [Thalassospiraceae bacterium LMO-JJ14]|nr:acyl carrier protein [Thalassospiraceae bacterium LMO-JJ14]
MDVQKEYDRVFVEIFEIDEEKLKENLEFNSIETWDSIGHLSLISELEECFDISLETDDIVDFSSYEKGKEILKKYGVAF